MSYTHRVTVTSPFNEAVARTRAALKEQGFGVITEIDMRATFATKLDDAAADHIGDYLILGACNPHLAYRAVGAEPELGALLPCNVVIRAGEAEGETIVETIDPSVLSQLTAAPEIAEVAKEADTRLRAALAAVSAVSD